MQWDPARRLHALFVIATPARLPPSCCADHASSHRHVLARVRHCRGAVLQGMESSPLDDTIPRYLSANVALFEVVDDDLLPIKPLGIQVTVWVCL